MAAVKPTAKPEKEERDYDCDNEHYSAKYDAHYNAITGKWTEKKCGWKKCEFCANRPKNALI